MMNKYELYGFVNVLKKLLGREISEDEISLIRIFNKSYREYTYFYPILTFHNSDSVFTNWVVVMQKVL